LFPPASPVERGGSTFWDVHAGGDTHQLLPPSEKGSRHQVLVPVGWDPASFIPRARLGLCLQSGLKVPLPVLLVGVHPLWRLPYTSGEHGIASIGLAAAYYSGDSLGWKLFYVSGCLFVAVQNLEDWQEAIFSKSTGKVVLKTSSLYRKLLTLCRAGHEQVVVQLSDIRDVSVEEEKVRYFGKGHVVVLRFATGFSHPLTQSAVMGHRGDVEAIARLITTFLELHRLESPAEPSQSSDSEADILGDHS
uniref:Essential for reactive oxygen species protein n=2 Tax=Sus scrofa TaxID=9823 RepID=A0A8D1UAU0_PIG